MFRPNGTLTIASLPPGSVCWMLLDLCASASAFARKANLPDESIPIHFLCRDIRLWLSTEITSLQKGLRGETLLERTCHGRLWFHRLSRCLASPRSGTQGCRDGQPGAPRQ